MNLDNPTGTVLYSLEQAIKTYRRFCQHNISQHLDDITVDQWLALLVIDKYSELSQVEIARMIFKDYASLTRMIDLLVKRGYLQRKPNPKDRRRHLLELTPKGKEGIKLLSPTVNYNREQALRGFAPDEIQLLESFLQRIIKNCLP